jgi:hypothetical protein
LHLGLSGTVNPSATLTLTGLTASGFVGTLTPGKAYPLLGDAAIAFGGTLGVNVTVALTGLSAAGSVGSDPQAKRLT